MTKAYSYIRFSTSKQELGDSLRRQLDMARKYAKEHNLELDEVSYRDLGVSAFKRKNIERGALAAFINAVETGKVEKGSYLLVEQFDRLSRADIDVAVKLLLDLVHSGIVLVTLDDQKVWNRETGKDMSNLILSIVFMSRANNESAAKASRLSEIWGRKKDLAKTSGKIVTSECPKWLRVNADKTEFEILEEKVESIRNLFDLRILGYGSVAIVNRANKEKWPVPGKGSSWHTSLVGRLLNNRALLGEYQPHMNSDDGKRIPVGDPVHNYYPSVLDEQIFLRAQAVSERKGVFPGRRDTNYRNWLQGLLKCPCGQSFLRKNKGRKSPDKPEYARYYCSARNRQASMCPSAASNEVEGAILNAIANIAPQFFEGSSRVEELKSRIEILEIDISAARKARDRYIEAIGSSVASIPALMESLQKAENALASKEQESAAARAELADLHGDTETVFENIVKAIRDADSVDARVALREDLSRIISRCVIHAAENFIEIFFRGSEAVPVIVPLNTKARLPGLQCVTP